jgi:uncharacterized membrane protein
VAEAKPLFYLTVLLAFGVTFARLLAGALDVAPRVRSRAWWLRLKALAVARALPFAVLLVCAAGYAFVLGRTAVAHHRLIQTVAADVGIADNVMSNLLHGHFSRAPAQFGDAPGNYPSLHGEYGALLFLPFYVLRPGAETLLWLQVAIAALGVVPLYFLVAARLGRKMALWFGLSYLLLAPLHGALLSGFTWLPAVTLFSLTLYYAVEAERRWLVCSALVALLAISEAGPLNGLAFGIFLLVTRQKPRWGLCIAAASAAMVGWDFVAAMRSAGSAGHPELGVSLAALIQNPVYFLLDVARAVKLTSVMHALAPLCLVPLFELATWPLFIPGLLFTSAGGEFWPNGHLGYASGVIWVPACLLALLFSLHKQRNEAQSRNRNLAWVMALTITQLSHSFDFGALLRADGFGGQETPDTYRMSRSGQARYDQLMNLVHRIPATASVAATDYLLSHVSNRPDAYELSRPYRKPDYILLSSREVGGIKRSLDKTFATHEYQLIGTTYDEFYLFSRGTETAGTKNALKRLGINAL